MKALPTSVSAYKRTPTFDQTTIPPGLLKAHKTKPGVWGKIVILSGELLYRIEEDGPQEERLTPVHHGVVAPEELHEVKALGEVSFYVEFYR